MSARAAFPSWLKSARLYLVMAVVLLLRAFVPTGYMVGTDGEDGGLVLEICNGQTASFLLFNPETGETMPMDDGEPGHDEGGAAENCPFALSAIASLDGLATEAVLPQFLRPSHELPQAELVFRSNLARAPPPARAPPVLI